MGPAISRSAYVPGDISVAAFAQISGSSSRTHSALKIAWEESRFAPTCR
jgi:hypothetical protein